MANLIAQDREAWLIEAGEYLISDILAPITDQQGLAKPPVKYSVSYPPNTRAGGLTLGACAPRSASTGGHNEIYISPELDGTKSSEVLAVLLHELIHAFTDCKDQHCGAFNKIARKVGFQTPIDRLNPSDTLKETLASYVDVLGAIPHDAVDHTQIKKKQKPRYHKVFCTNEGCDFKFNTSQKQIDQMNHATCLVCGTETLEQEIKEEIED